MTERTVLVVEDDPDCLQAIEAALLSVGHRVITASDGDEALERIEHEGAPDVILLDLRLPRMDGAAFLAERAQRPALRRVRVVLLSAERDTAALAVRMKVGACLAKPVDLEALLAVVAG
jgi:CheY-like chemotaxis protein